MPVVPVRARLTARVGAKDRGYRTEACFASQAAMGLAGGATRPFGKIDLVLEVRAMATDKQKEAARRNIEKAREVQSERAHGEDIPRSADGLSTAEKDRLPEAEFAFPSERKEPLSDAAHVRNAIARFDQVEGVTDEERDQAWKRIRTAAGKYGVDISENDWRDLASGGNDRRLPGLLMLRDHPQDQAP
jgi:hypothetical protein